MNRILFLLLLGISFTTNAQSDSLCRNELKRLFDKINAISSPSDGQVGKIEYSIHLKSLNPNEPDVKQEISLLITDKYYEMQSPEATIYADQKDQIIIYHPQKYIVISYSQTDPMKDNKMDQLKTFQSSFIDMASNVSCDNDVYTIVTSEKLNGLAIENIQYRKNKESTFFESATIMFEDNPKIKSLDLIVTDYSLKKSDNNIINIWGSINGKNGNLKPEYNSYNIVDLRK